jgi:hypothetical protein
MSGPSLLFISEQPVNVNAQGLRDGFKFVVKYMTVIIFDFGDRGSVELNPKPSKLTRKGILS